MHQRLILTIAAVRLVAKGCHTHRMLLNGSEFHVKMRREPVFGLEVSEELLSCRTSQRVGLHFLTQKLLLPQQFCCTSMVVDSTRPVVAHEDVYGHLDLCVNKDLRIGVI